MEPEVYVRKWKLFLPTPICHVSSVIYNILHRQTTGLKCHYYQFLKPTHTKQNTCNNYRVSNRDILNIIIRAANKFLFAQNFLNLSPSSHKLRLTNSGNNKNLECYGSDHSSFDFAFSYKCLVRDGRSSMETGRTNTHTHTHTHTKWILRK